MLRKLLDPWIWKRIYFELLGEPLIINIVSIWVFFFGSIFIKNPNLIKEIVHLRLKVKELRDSVSVPISIMGDR